MITLDQLKPHQLDILQAHKKYIVVNGGVGTFKTTTCIMKLISHCIHNPGQVIGVVAQTYGQLSNVFLPEFTRQMPAELYQYNGAKNQIYIPKWDSWLYLHYADHPKAHVIIKSETWSGWYMIQAESLKSKEILDECDRRIRLFDEYSEYKYIRLVDTNPGNPSHFIYKSFIDSKDQTYMGSKNIDLINIQTTTETSKYSQETLDLWKKTWPEQQYKRMVDGQWTSDSGLIFNEWHVNDKPINNDEIIGYIIGVDPGHGKHNFGIIVLALMDNYTWKVIDEKLFNLGWEGWGVEQSANIINELIDKWGVDKCICASLDWSAYGYKSELAKLCPGLEGKVFFPTNNKIRTKWFKVKNGLDIMEVAFRNRDLAIHESCTETIDSLNKYAWTDDGEPDKKAHDPHLLDALRYSYIRGYNYYTKERVENYGI